MDFQTIIDHIRLCEGKKELSAEDILSVQNAVYFSLAEDNGVPLTSLPVSDPESLADGLVSQMYGVLSLYEKHKTLLEGEALEEIGGLASEIAQLEKNCRQRKLARKQYAEQIKAYEQEKAELETVETEIADMRRILDSCSSDELTKKKALRDGLRKQCEELAEETETLRQSVKTAEDRLTSLRQENDRLTAENRRNEAESVSAEAENKELTEKKAGLEARKQKAEADIPALKTDIRMLETDIESFTGILSADGAERDRLKSKLEELETERTELERASAEITESILSDKAVIAARKKQIPEKEAEAKRVLDEKNEAEAQCRALDRQISEGNTDIEKLNNELTQKRSDLCGYGSLEERQKQLWEKLSQLEPQWQQFHQLVAKVQNLEKELEEKERKLNDLSECRRRAEQKKTELDRILTAEKLEELQKLKIRLYRLEQISENLRKYAKLMNPSEEPVEPEEPVTDDKAVAGCRNYLEQYEHLIKDYLEKQGA